MNHARRAIVIPHPEGSKEAARIAGTVKNALEDEMEEMGVHGEVRVSMDGVHYEVLFRFHDASCVSVLPGATDVTIENASRLALSAMRENIRDRASR